MSVYYIESLTDNKDDIKRLIDNLKQTKLIGLDTEDSGLSPFQDVVLLIQLLVNGDVYVINRGSVGASFSKNLIQLIKDMGITCIGHNIKFDIKMLKSDTGIWLTNVYDTQIAESVIMAGLETKISSLKKLLSKYLSIELSKDDRMEFVGMRHGDTFNENLIKYSALDVLYLEDLYNKLQDEAGKAYLDKIIDIEMMLVPVVAEMEYTGISLDKEYWSKLTEEAIVVRDRLAIQMKEIIFKAIDKSKYSTALEFADALRIPVKTKTARNSLSQIVNPDEASSYIIQNFNIGSHQQLLTALHLAGIDTPDTNEKTLSKLPKNEIIDVILEYRDYEKRISTYGYNIIALVNPVTDKIHTEYYQVGTQTGRFSSRNPNLQNIPTHNGYREGFVARPGYSFMAMDYSQQEYRLAGALSKEPAIIYAYVLGFDMHTASAAKRYNKDFKDVTKEERSKGKGINFTVLYGGTEYALGKNLKVPTEEAKKILADFFVGYPRLHAYKERAESKIVELGFSVTPLGRRRYFKPLPAFCTPREIDSYTSRMKREGFNMIIQGGGADVTKIAMLDIAKNNPFGHDKFHMLLQVHDEIVAEVLDDILDEAEAFMREQMVAAFQPFLGEIPALVDCKISKQWTKS